MTPPQSPASIVGITEERSHWPQLYSFAEDGISINKNANPKKEPYNKKLLTTMI
ncbi:hypothetical protein VB739_07445 [Cyanobium gracile UHCC 0281]|uniref:Uncharacterized protein n=1 Tax=Cyanobium gracile UHCC 0281 TaxID=3110309 RepID=A0ABU5SVJ1_9CYAN|nr:hypothetical protein [Cyanobium gracile UHCC 0281]